MTETPTPHPGNGAVIRLDGVTKLYPFAGGAVQALRDINLVIRHGEFVAIMGASGSGKSTLMNIIGLLDRPDRGKYFLNGIDTSAMDDNQLSGLRNRAIGFVFQNFNLLPNADALRNVMLPLTYRPGDVQRRKHLAAEMLTRLGLGDRLHHRPSQLSGGERQRVAIARALITSPAVLLADEPTGNLDSRAGSEIMELLTNLAAQGQTVVMVTHDPAMAALADRIVRMRDGRLMDE